MHGSYWSLEGCCWEPGPKSADALVTPWSSYVLPVPALPHPADAAEVLRMPSRQTLHATAVPAQREQVAEPVSR